MAGSLWCLVGCFGMLVEQGLLIDLGQTIVAQQFRVMSGKMKVVQNQNLSRTIQLQPVVPVVAGIIAR